MNDFEQWQKNNENYLSAGLEWLRLRLNKLAGPAKSSAPQSSGLFGRKSAPTPKTVSDKEITRAFSAVETAESAEPLPAMTILTRRFDLSRFEQQVLFLCAAMEYDTRISSLCARAQDDPNRQYPTFALGMVLFEEPAWDVLSPERPLRYWRLIEINQAGPQPVTACPLRADERIVNFIKGLNYLDDRLLPMLSPLDITDTNEKLPPSQYAAVETIVRALKQNSDMNRPPLIQLLGPDIVSKQLIAQQAAFELGLNLYRLPAELLPAQAGELENIVRLWQRESILLPIALYVDAHELDKSENRPAQLSSLHHFLSRITGVLFLDTRDVFPGLSNTSISLDIAKPTPAEQRAAWAAELVEMTDNSAVQLANQFNLNVTTIKKISHRAIVEADKNSDILQSKLWENCLANTRPQLDVLAQRLDPKATWGDIVLPEEAKTLLRQIADQVAQRSKVYDDWGFRNKMNRGLGISVLFTGDSGTGKTMAAEVIANDLRLNLFRIDLSAVVNKYIGETEKNLRRLFDAAEGGGAILFFDEADALFGKRSEVKDSHDRYANIEINYLLQRIEAYQGLAILATNMKSAMDTAFIRRLRFIVNFPFPGPTERKEIWKNVFPPETPTAELDYDRLARLNLTGGSIHNIAINATFRAAQENALVTVPLILKAARVEFRKLERPINEADFRI